MPIYDLLEYSSNYSIASGSLWNFYRDEETDAANEVVVNHGINNSQKTIFKFFEYKTRIIEKSPAHDNKLDTEVVSLKCLIE